MKKTLFLIICQVMTSLLIAQSGPISIQGKITNNTAKKVVIENESGEKFEVPIDANNEAKGVINAAKGHYNMTIGQEYTPIYLKPNSSLNFTIDLKEFDESISYTGMLAGENNALAKALLADDGFQQKMGEYFKLDENEFTDKMNAHLKVKSAAFSGKMDEEFKQNEINDLKLTNYTYLFQYPSYHKYMTKNDSFEPSDKFYNFVNEIDINKSENFKGKNLGLLDSYLGYTLKDFKPAKDDNDAYTVALFNQLNELIKDNKLKDEYIESYYKSSIKYSTDHSKITELITASATKAELKAEIKEFYSKFSTLAEGKPAPGFKLLSSNGNQKALADYRGKYVYIDVWATWCGPCKKELPDYEKLKADYKGKNVEFVSVCVWDSKTNWDKFLAERKLGGEQLFIEGQTNNFTENYMIQGVPTFILVDPQGNIVSANAERPSDKAVRERLNKLVN